METAIAQQAREAEQQITHLRRERSRSAVEIASIHKLPNELLLEIWKHIICDGWMTRIKHGMTFPILASWVSRRWRYVALNSPTLWCNIKLFNPRCIEVLKAKLERSKDCSLDIKVDLSLGLEYDEDNVIQIQNGIAHLLSIASDHMGRWRTFRVSASQQATGPPDGDSYLERILRPLRSAYAPRLQGLYIYCYGDVRSGSIFGGGAPLLTEVHLAGWNLRSNQTLLFRVSTLYLGNIPFSGRPTHAEFHELIKNSPCLTNLEIEGLCIEYDTTASDYTTIHIPSLLSLTVSCTDEDIAWHLLKYLSVPNLHSLTLDGRSLELPDFVNALDSAWPQTKYPFLSIFSLRVLFYYVSSSDWDLPHDGALLKIVQLLPTVTELQLDQMAIPFLKWLAAQDETCHSSDDALWPRLHSLTLSSLTHAGVLRRFISKRSSIGIPIIIFRIRSYEFSEWASIDREWFRSHVKVEEFE